MSTRDRRLHQYLRVGCDLLAVLTAWAIARAPGLITRGPLALVPPALLPAMWIPTAYWLRLYRRPVQEGMWAVVTRVAECSILLNLIAIVGASLFGPGPESYGWRVAVSPVPIALLAFSLTHFLALAVCHVARRQWPSKRGVAVVGTAKWASRVMDSDRALRDALGIRGLIVPEHAKTAPFSPEMRVLGTTRQLAELINREDLERVIVANDELPEEERETCSRVSGQMGVTVSWVVGRWGGEGRPELATTGGLLLLDLQPVRFSRAQERLKRALDLAGGVMLTLLFTPLMLAIALLIKASSPGPVLYRSQRVGKGGRHFTFLKFRSMYADSDRTSVSSANEKDGHIFKIRQDPRVTPVGRFLRRFSLDELPQFVNVLRGDMSLVGPRPLPAADLDPDGMSARFSAWSEQRSRVRPGITGLWQVQGRSELPFEQMMLLDVEYIREWSIGLDLKILLLTPELVLSGRGAF